MQKTIQMLLPFQHSPMTALELLTNETTNLKEWMGKVLDSCPDELHRPEAARPQWSYRVREKGSAVELQSKGRKGATKARGQTQRLHWEHTPFCSKIEQRNTWASLSIDQILEQTTSSSSVVISSLLPKHAMGSLHSHSPRKHP